MKQFDVRRTIAASPERIWELLTDARTLAAGTFGLRRIEGTIAPGARLRVWSAINPGRAFALRVTEFVPHAHMVWEGGMPFGLFRGVRRFTLTPRGTNTEFQMHEVFSGPLAPLIERSIPDLQPSFETFADALCTMAERDTR